MKFVAKYLMIGLMLGFTSTTFAMLGQGPTYTSPTIVLRFQPEITKHASKLGDVLRIQKIRAATVKEWTNIPLDSHPTPGDIITREKILDWMTQRIGHIDVIWQGKTQIIVKKSTQSSSKMLEEKAKTALIDKLSPHYFRVDVTPLSHLNDSEYELDTFKIKAKLRIPTATRVCIWLVNKKTRIPVWFKVRAYANVLVANRDLPTNHRIQTTDVSLQERNVAGLSALPATSLSPDLWLKSSIKRDQIVRADQLKKAPLIVCDQHIKVATHNHSITIVMDAIALADGYLGDTISVQNSLNKKIVNAKITGHQQAELTL